MKYLILGAGKMGRAVAFDLIQSNETTEVKLADIDFDRAKAVAKWLDDPRIFPTRIDVENSDEIYNSMKGVNVVIGCISYKHNFELAKTAIKLKVNFCDLGGNNTIVQKQFSLDEEAKKAGVTVIPDCGLAPGIVSIFVVHAAEEFDKINEIYIRVGGLPQNPKPPLNYTLLFSVEGLLNEYLENAEIIHEGKLMEVPSMTAIEEIEFPKPFGKLEAFYTSGGASTLPKTYLGKVEELDYKTIRYKGHCEKMKTILDIGFRSEKELEFDDDFKISPRKFLERVLESHFTQEESKDVTLLRVEVKGLKNNKKKKKTIQIIDYYDETNKLTSMMRLTAFSASIIAQMIARDEIAQKGVIVQEFNVPSKRMIEELQKRNIKIEEKLE